MFKHRTALCVRFGRLCGDKVRIARRLNVDRYVRPEIMWGRCHRGRLYLNSIFHVPSVVKLDPLDKT
jgi:hypothetical protein